MIAKSTHQKLLGAHVRSLRLARNLTQQELAARVDKDRQRIERGEVSPTAYYLFELAEALRIDQKEILNFNVKRLR